MKRKISVICTVRNEESALNALVDSILSQKRLPDEIVFVDGGSVDRTLEILKSYGKKLRVISSPGANIAEGRNIAIRSAKGEWVASIDGGCVADKDWLLNLERKMSFADVVSGAYLPIGKTRFERVQGRVVVKNPEKLDSKSFLPSSRSVAFKKSVWLAVGGYPENTYTAEDTLFDMKLKRAGFRFALARDAIVFWRMRATLSKFAKQFFLYGKGDGKTGLVFRMPLNLAMATCFLLAFALLFLGNFWLLGAIMGALVLVGFSKSRSVQEFPIALLLVSVKRIAYSVGVFWGLVQK